MIKSEQVINVDLNYKKGMHSGSYLSLKIFKNITIKAIKDIKRQT